jgi:hypothetical protein
MLKKEEKRIKKLVMLAYENDPRIKRFEMQKEEEKRLKKEQMRKMKQSKKEQSK